MTEPQLHHVDCPDASGGHRMAYWQWGAADAPHAVVCVHGLSRQGRDFDVLARALVEAGGGRLRVICPDIVGRGRSDWLQDPASYQVMQYAADMLAMIAQLRPSSVDWVGTSLGGLIGMALAGQPALPFALRRLVLNDVGPALQWQAMQRIGTYLGNTGRFETVEQAADALLAISSTFGPHTREQWLALSRPMLRALDDGGYTLHYDPAIAQPFAAITPERAERDMQKLWQFYDAIRVPTLLLRGAESDFLSRETAQAMTQRGPKAQLVEFAGVGHAPTLVADDQVRAVRDFLLPLP